MRELVIERIRDSRRWKQAWESGEDMPKLEDMPTRDLLSMYDFFVHGMLT